MLASRTAAGKRSERWLKTFPPMRYWFLLAELAEGGRITAFGPAWNLPLRSGTMPSTTRNPPGAGLAVSLGAIALYDSTDATSLFASGVITNAGRASIRSAKEMWVFSPPGPVGL